MMRINRSALHWAAGLLVIAVVVSSVMAYFVDAEFVARNLSPDGILSAAMIRMIQVFRILAGLVSILTLVALGVILKGGHAAAQRAANGLYSLLERRPEWLFRLTLLLVLAPIGAFHFMQLLDTWDTARGAEYEDIARSIAVGQGFSMNESDRWYWYDFSRDESEYSTDVYFPTAIEEPLYPLLLGTSFRLFGEVGAFPVLLLQLIAWLATCVLVYSVGRRALGRAAGLMAAAGLAMYSEGAWLATGYFGPGPFGGLFIMAIAYAAIRTRPEPNFRFDLLLGTLLGVAFLTIASSQVFIPVVVAFVIFVRGWNRGRSWVSAGIIVVCVMAVISPWTIRNWQTFGEFVPVRTGSGLAMHQGNPILAASFHSSSQACTDTLGPIWSATGPRDAVRQVRFDQEKEMAMYKRSFECVAERAPENYKLYNEIQRDRFYFSEAMDFIKSEPLVFAELAFHKYLAVFNGTRLQHAIVGWLALFGALLALKNKEGVMLVLMVGAFIGPYALVAPGGFRYRYPIEPLLILSAMHFMVSGAQLVRSSIFRRYRPEREENRKATAKA